MRNDSKTTALQAAWEAACQAKPHLNTNNARDREVWEALERLQTVIIKLPPRS